MGTRPRTLQELAVSLDRPELVTDEVWQALQELRLHRGPEAARMVVELLSDVWLVDYELFCGCLEALGSIGERLVSTNLEALLLEAPGEEWSVSLAEALLSIDPQRARVFFQPLLASDRREVRVAAIMVMLRLDVTEVRQPLSEEAARARNVAQKLQLLAFVDSSTMPWLAEWLAQRAADPAWCGPTRDQVDLETQFVAAKHRHEGSREQLRRCARELDARGSTAAGFLLELGEEGGLELIERHVRERKPSDDDWRLFNSLMHFAEDSPEVRPRVIELLASVPSSLAATIRNHLDLRLPPRGARSI